ncbi:MAG: choice-of-anchor Q domain-containing protein [Anaerolineales bacterium]
MFEKHGFSIHVRFALVVALVAGLYSTAPVTASANINALSSDILNAKNDEGRGHKAAVLDSAGSLDATFDGDGLVTTPIANERDAAGAIAIQPDGKIVVAGIVRIAAFDDFLVARYNTNGSLDSSFDFDGIVTTDFGASDGANGLAIQADGKIVVTGYSSGEPFDSDAKIAIVRYNPNGTLDTSFDQDGKLMTNLGAGYDYASVVALQTDGKILVAGVKNIGINNNDIALVRYLPNGTLDSTFDGDGIVTTEIGVGTNEFASSIALQLDGKIVVVGTVDNSSNSDFALLRYQMNGVLDSSFDGDGIVTIDFNAGTSTERGGVVALQNDGRILIAGNDFAGHMLLARFDINGLPDTSFDVDGRVSVVFGQDINVSDIDLQQDNKIVLAGYLSSFSPVNNYNFALARFDSNGSLDNSFSTDGKITTDFGSNQDDFGVAAAIQADGKIVVAGSRYTGGSNYDVALARYIGDATSLLVTKTADTNDGICDNDCSLREAIANAFSGYTITFDPSLSGQTITLGSTLILDKDMTIDGSNLTTNVRLDGQSVLTTLLEINNPDEIYPTVTISDIDFLNGAQYGIFHARGELHVINSYFSGNQTGVQSGTKLIVTNSRFDGNFTGIYNFGVLQVQNSEFTNNNRGLITEGVYYLSLPGDATINNSVFIQNTQGAVQNRNGALVVTDTNFTNNASDYGGAIMSNGVSAEISRSAFVNNSATQYGGAIQGGGNLTVTDSVFTGNAATIDGGAVASTTWIILSKSVFSSNTAGNFGGAIAAQSDGQIENSTFYNNSAAMGGGLYVQNGNLSFRLANNTISQSTGGGIYNSGNSLELFNNIIANSITGADCYTITMFGVTGNNNLVETNAPSPNACGSVSISADPLLGSLQDNGGFTQTMALLPGSPAIDAADVANCPSTDQRGVTRPQGSGCDIGAYEYDGPIGPTPTSTPTDTATPIPTFTPTSTFTPLPSFTPIPTATETQTVSPTWTSTPTATASSGFPSSNVLDTFNRANGGVGASWSGSTSGYSIASNRLDVGNGAPMLWNATSFGANQEVFVTLTNIDPSGFYQDLILKSQSATSWESGAIDVSYDAAGKRVIVWTFSNAQGWARRGADIPVTFVNGDQFGVRARSNGIVEIYRNGVLIATRDVSAWTYSASGGYIGVWYQGAANALLDDFGGGSLSSVPTATLIIPTISTLTPAPSSTATNIPTSTQTLVPSFTPSITSTPTRTPTLSVTSTSTPTPSMFIQVLQPNGGEVLNVGSTYRITWNSSSNIDKVSIGYKSCDSCLDWIAFSTPNVGYYDWNVSVGNTINTQFKISITGYDTGVGSVTDLSDANFTVLQPTPTPTPTFTRTPTATSLPSLTPTATTSSGFPSSNVLDTFNRANGGVGANWSGSTSGYSIASNRLDVGTGAPLLWNTSFGTDQEVFVTLTNIDPSGFYQDLILKSQSATSWESGAIDVSYDAAGKRVIVWTFSNAQGWVRRGADIPVTFVNGDQLVSARDRMERLRSIATVC